MLEVRNVARSGWLPRCQRAVQRSARSGDSHGMSVTELAVLEVSRRWHRGGRTRDPRFDVPTAVVTCEGASCTGSVEDRKL